MHLPCAHVHPQAAGKGRTAKAGRLPSTIVMAPTRELAKQVRHAGDSMVPVQPEYRFQSAAQRRHPGLFNLNLAVTCTPWLADATPQYLYAGARGVREHR